MFCSKCGAVVEGGTKYCSSCGQAVSEANGASYSVPGADGLVSAPSAPDPKKKKNGCLIAAIIVFVVLVAVVVIAVSMFSVTNTQDGPWQTPLPEGLLADIQLIDDDCTMLIHYHNNTGKDIALTTYSLFGDANGDPFMDGASSMMYFADGTERIEILDSWDEIVYYSLDYELGEPYKKIKEANEALSVDSWRNSDNSVSATFSSPDGASVSGNLFFLDDAGNVLGYQYFGIGFADSMDYDFDAPDYDYTDYLLCFEAMS